MLHTISQFNKDDVESVDNIYDDDDDNNNHQVPPKVAANFFLKSQNKLERWANMMLTQHSSSPLAGWEKMLHTVAQFNNSKPVYNDVKANHQHQHQHHHRVSILRSTFSQI